MEALKKSPGERTRPDGPETAHRERRAESYKPGGCPRSKWRSARKGYE